MVDPYSGYDEAPPPRLPHIDRPDPSHNPVIAEHYARKRAAGKSKMNALCHCMAKALALVWGVWRGGRDFDPAYRA
jgi:hypothetical protein